MVYKKLRPLRPMNCDDRFPFGQTVAQTVNNHHPTPSKFGYTSIQEDRTAKRLSKK
jgi:hypothetical protein